MAGVDKGDVAVASINTRLMKVPTQRESNGVSCIVAPTLDKSTIKKYYFLSKLDEVIKGVPK